MRQTIVEKIFSNKMNKRVVAGDVVVSSVDFCYSNDFRSSNIIDLFHKMELSSVFDKARYCMVMDHYTPSPNIRAAGIHDKMRNFSREYGLKVFDVECGISHNSICENGLVSAGDIVVGSDRYAGTLGALNVFGLNVTDSDIAMALASGRLWFKVPETIAVVLEGETQKGVYAKDVAMHIACDMALEEQKHDTVIEFSGDMVDKMEMEERFTLVNYAIASGSKSAIMPADKKTIQFLKKRGAVEPNPVDVDEDPLYLEIREYDMTELEPQVARSGSAADVVDIEEVENVKLNQVCIGTCSNGSFSDMEVAAKILKGKKIAPGLKTIVTPASKTIFAEMLKKGLVSVFLDAGAIVNNPGCGSCAGTHQGVLADGEVSFSTSNNNCTGAMGNKDSEIYLGSPAIAAASAIAGKIADPREYKRKL